MEYAGFFSENKNRKHGRERDNPIWFNFIINFVKKSDFNKDFVSIFFVFINVWQRICCDFHRNTNQKNVQFFAPLEKDDSSCLFFFRLVSRQIKYILLLITVHKFCIFISSCSSLKFKRKTFKVRRKKKHEIITLFFVFRLFPTLPRLRRLFKVL